MRVDDDTRIKRNGRNGMIEEPSAVETTSRPDPGGTLAVAAAGTLLVLQVLRGRRERGEPLAIPNRECFPFCDNHRDGPAWAGLGGHGAEPAGAEHVGGRQQ